MNGGGPGNVRSPGLVCKTVRCRNPSLPTTPSTTDVSSCSRELPPPPATLPFDVVSLLFELPGELELAALELLAPDVLVGLVDAILLAPFVFLFDLLALLLLLLPPFP